MSKKDKERAKRVQALCAEIRNTIFDNDGNAVGKYSDKNIIFDETGTYPIGKKLEDGSVVYFNIYKGKEKHEIKEDKDMENYIVINGKKAELTEEQLEKLGIKAEKKNKHEEMFKCVYGDLYFYIDQDDDVQVKQEYLNDVDARLHHTGNYCKDEEIMKQRALHETLNRLLWRASVEAGELDNPWDGNNFHFYIYYNSGALKIDNNYVSHYQGTCYFPTEDAARDALEKIVMPFLREHPEFKW